MTTPLLCIQNFSMQFETHSGVVKVLDDVSLTIEPGETVGLVGESGSGKSTVAMAAIGLLGPNAQILSGSIYFKEEKVLDNATDNSSSVRGPKIATIFQSPKSCLNPIRKLGKQIEDVLQQHRPTTKSAAKEHALDLLKQVKLPNPEDLYHAFPFQLSGGMCQRAMIAIALAARPQLLIADEPTTGLDMTTQGEVMDLISQLNLKYNMATLLITHDIALAGQACSRLAIMHAGHVVEAGILEAILQNPRHPYSSALLSAMPWNATTLEDISSIEGDLPNLNGTLHTCRFYTRCDRSRSDCRSDITKKHGDEFSHYIRCNYPL